jgi:hypothetical protein
MRELEMCGYSQGILFQLPRSLARVREFCSKIARRWGKLIGLLSGGHLQWFLMRGAVFLARGALHSGHSHHEVFPIPRSDCGSSASELSLSRQ